MWTSVLLAAPKTNLICKFLCFLNLPPSDMEWPTFFSLSLPCKYGGRFQVSARELLRVRTNKLAVVLETERVRQLYSLEQLATFT